MLKNLRSVSRIQVFANGCKVLTLAKNGDRKLANH